MTLNDVTLQRMMLYIPDNRVTAKAAISHRYLRNTLMNLPNIATLFD